MQLIVFHYHLLPGGVTDVILHSIQAIALHREDISSVRLVCGREENTNTVVAGLTEIGINVDSDILSQLDYTPRTEPADVALARVDELESLLLARYATDDALWWIHNFHVGKNPAFTLALCRIAEKAAPPRMLLHIHDFPECARYENLAYLTRITGESPYPAGPTVRYAVINARDRALMGETEIPDDHVHLLVNPLPRAEDPAGARPARSTLVSALTRFAADNGQKFDPAGPLLLYPIRTIRRKNVLEMALIARLADSANLIVTLPGVSEAERPYSDLIAAAFGSGAARGVWGIGRREHEYGLTFQDLTHGADAIVSSSVQEGFGLLFINALRWRVPLFARHLSILDGVGSVFDNYPASFYADLQIPMKSPSISELQSPLRMRYSERLGKLEEYLPASARARLNQQLETILTAPSIDYAYLPADLQFSYLSDLADPGFAADINAMNHQLIDALMTVQSLGCPDATEEIERMFGFGAFADAFDRVVRSYDNPATPPPASSRRPAGRPSSSRAQCRRYESAQHTLIEGFADLEFLRLLFAPMDQDRG